MRSRRLLLLRLCGNFIELLLNVSNKRHLSGVYVLIVWPKKSQARLIEKMKEGGTPGVLRRIPAHYTRSGLAPLDSRQPQRASGFDITQGLELLVDSVLRTHTIMTPT
jgi:hypothetical protein